MITKSEFKETDIGLMPDDWEVIKLGDCIDTKKGRKPETLTNSFEDGFEPYLTADYFRTGNTKQFVDVEKEKNSIIVNKEDIVLIWDGSNAGDVFTGLRGILASTMVKIIPKNNLTRQHLFYFLKTKFDILNEKTTGSTIPHVSKSIFEGLPFVLPPLIEQQKITFVLSKIQQAIEQQEQIITKTKELKRSLMHRLFTYGLRGEELKETEIGLMPESWNVVSLRDYVELITKGSSPNWQGFEYCQEGITFIRSQNIGWGDLLLNEVQHLPEGFNKKEKKSIIKENDVLINLVGASIGRVAIATKVIEGGNLNQAVAIVRLRLNSFTPKFLVQYLLTQMGQKQIHLNKKEIARANISLQDVNNFIVVRPEMEEQEEISQTLKAVDEKINCAHMRHNKLSELFKSMLQLLMTGQVRVKDIDFGEINV